MRYKKNSGRKQLRRLNPTKKLHRLATEPVYSFFKN